MGKPIVVRLVLTGTPKGQVVVILAAVAIPEVRPFSACFINLLNALPKFLTWIRLLL
jgi:hypothetical protein